MDQTACRANGNCANARFDATSTTLRARWWSSSRVGDVLTAQDRVLTAAQHPDAVIVPDVNALRDWLRTSLEAQLTPLIEGINASTRLGRHAQWCLVADSCASLFLHGGTVIKDEAHGLAEGRAFIKAAGSPMKNPKTDYVSLQYLEHRDTFLTRGGCCRYYTFAEDGEKCSTCVLRNPEERDQLLLDYMSRKYAQGAAS